jgi:hypothetical protein
MSRLPLLGLLICLALVGFLAYRIITKSATFQSKNELTEHTGEIDLQQEPGNGRDQNELPLPFVAEMEHDSNNKSDHADLDLLKRMGVGTDTASLIEYLKKHSPEDVDPGHLETWIQQLGNANIATREEAFSKLTAIGLTSLTFLVL